MTENLTFWAHRHSSKVIISDNIVKLDQKVSGSFLLKSNTRDSCFFDVIWLLWNWAAQSIYYKPSSCMYHAWRMIANNMMSFTMQLCCCCLIRVWVFLSSFYADFMPTFIVNNNTIQSQHIIERQKKLFSFFFHHTQHFLSILYLSKPFSVLHEWYVVKEYIQNRLFKMWRNEKFTVVRIFLH
jgi:hypothetical protein